MSASLAAFFSDTPFQPPFGGGELTEGVLASDHLRVRSLVFPPGDPVSPVPVGDVGVASPFRQILLDPTVAPLLHLHPFQSAQGREGEKEWLFACREVLRERLGYGALGSPVASREGLLEQAEGMLAAWVREKYLIEPEGIVFVATEEEIASGTLPAEASTVSFLSRISFSPAHLYLFTPAAIEAEIACGSGRGAVTALVEAIHHVGSLAGLASVDIRWIGAGLHPARLGFDLAFFDFSLFLEGEGEWHLPAYDRSLVSWLSPEADEAWTNRPDFLLRVDAGLRLMGEAGLASAATAAAIRADYLRTLLARAGVEGYGRALLEVAVPGRGCFRFSGLETAADVEALLHGIAQETSTPGPG